MSDTVEAPYGSWQSPINAALIASSSIRIDQIFCDKNSIFWLESRPAEKGRTVIVCRNGQGEVSDITPEDFSVRTRAHEYGGGAAFAKNSNIYFVNDKTQRLYKQAGNDSPKIITPDKNYKFADGIFDELHNQIICMMEDHTGDGEETNTLVAVNPDTGAITTLAGGNDFYASPTISPDGKQLAWLTWNRPAMPWDSTELWTAQIDETGNLSDAEKLAGGERESIFQPQFSPDGTLYFVSDKNNWWNIYRRVNGKVDCVHQRQAEFGLPQWVFGMSTYAFPAENKIACSFFENGQWNLGLLDLESGELEIVDMPFTFIDQVRAIKGKAVFSAGSPVSVSSVVLLDVKTKQFEIIRRSADPKIDTTYFSRPVVIEFPTENNQTAHAYFYPPQNRDFVGRPDKKPPLIVKSHGGPTGATKTQLELKLQFWTSRGFAVVDVNYGGSTGYGRDYRERLYGEWGVLDVADCVKAAKYLVQKGLVDKNQLAIAGGSAGGYTTLCALTFHDLFKAGASYYGICDLEALVEHTCKFETRYFDQLIGPYPEKQALYRERSPIYHTERLSCPTILMQGLEDKIVLPEQAEKMVAALKAKSVPVAYLPFEGEQHGFRRAENIQRSLEAELYFYSKIFGFELAEEIEPVDY